MSYCRFSKNSDVYMFATFEDSICCCCCSLIKGEDMFFGGKPVQRARGALSHLLKHIEIGQKVPQSAIARLSREIEGG